ncbi:hypothetical protein AALJ87_10115 [Bacteroides uniformis]|uniref:hypothetical protein n=1 Tax=Bacteroides uniformis TaxID=820 RepID=UPI0035179617
MIEQPGSFTYKRPTGPKNVVMCTSLICRPILYGVAKAITEHISSGERYHHVKKVYSISILYFDIREGEDYLYHRQNNCIGVRTKIYRAKR